MHRIVHVQTIIQTTFGVLDDEGNVIPQAPVVAQVGRFSEDAFREAFAAIAQARDQAALAAGPPPESDGGAAVRIDASAGAE